jgi:hypothetical protein
VAVVRNQAANVKSLAGLIAETLAGVYLTAWRADAVKARLYGSLKFGGTNGGTFVEGKGSGEPVFAL